MKLFKIIISFTLLISLSYLATISVYAFRENIVSTEPQLVESTNSTDEGNEERYNFDFASLLSLLSIGFLKFIDDKLKIKLKENYSVYEKCVYGTMSVFIIIEVLILIFFFFKIGSPSFGNLKNVFLGLIPVLFCIITAITMKSESTTLILSQTQLEKKINDFTSCGMSPLGMIVGDMDFFGYVCDSSPKKKKRKKNGKNNILTNAQIATLQENNIDNIQIVCKKPKTQEDRHRIGYLLSVFSEKLEIKFFDEQKFPIPKMRGRIMYKQNMQVVVITRKIKKGSEYEYCEHKADSLPGGLFADLWNTVWPCSTNDQNILNRCKQEYTSLIEEDKIC